MNQVVSPGLSLLLCEMSVITSVVPTVYSCKGQTSNPEKVLYEYWLLVVSDALDVTQNVGGAALRASSGSPPQSSLCYSLGCVLGQVTAPCLSFPSCTVKISPS